MNEFSLIDVYFKQPAIQRPEVIIGIGDDAACMEIPHHCQLLVSTDTLVAEVHFLSEWDAYDIACKAVMVNVSDMAAMGAEPCWMSLALTLPSLDEQWLTRFSQGFHDSLKQYNIMLIGGDTTHGPLSMTLTIHGLVEKGKAVKRSGAKPGDRIFVSGALGAAAQAVAFLHHEGIDSQDKQTMMRLLMHPRPRVDLAPLLRTHASAAIDISDGLSADLNHICVQSGVRALLNLDAIPVHPLVVKYQQDKAIDFAIGGGDDYELCFTIPRKNETEFTQALKQAGLACFPIGVIEEGEGLYTNDEGQLRELTPRGYSHF
ncbi:thiamine-phosphate kinase [Legionella sp. MW5194]|uniref:thiamine-phosphate kinase n=1 Tax=Legionella sp. MW5194 TaxID=2662448 RepID=UPI00193D7F26|nr:thiamine-phosphate kinase [Legionella sp. MW5194]QRN04372.1 thiamine-phosphate kinase [Legionella sp. MW5194]